MVRRQARGSRAAVKQSPASAQAAGGRPLLGTLPPAAAFLEDCYLNRQELGVGAPGGGSEP